MTFWGCKSLMPRKIPSSTYTMNMMSLQKNTQSSISDVVNPNYGHEFVHEEWVPYASSLFLAVHVFLHLQYVILGIFVLGLDPLWQFHVDVHLDWSLRICHNKVHLSNCPTENDAKDNHKSDGKPCHNRCICLKIVHAKDLLSTVEVQPCLVWLDPVSCERSCLRLSAHTEGTNWTSSGTLFLFCSVKLLQSTSLLTSFVTACTNSLTLAVWVLVEDTWCHLSFLCVWR